MDFQNAKLPALLPLAGSFAENETEEELKRFFIDLFGEFLAEDTFDANVLGAAHLGTSRLVSRSIARDGLVMLPGEGEEERSRYAYRAWMSANKQGRGLHFLATYLQMQFPNEWEVWQLWHDKHRAEDYPAHLFEDDGCGANFLTSRLKIRFYVLPTEGLSDKISACLSLILPARFIPQPIQFAVLGKHPGLWVGGIGTPTAVLQAEGALNDPPLWAGGIGTPTAVLQCAGNLEAA